MPNPRPSRRWPEQVRRAVSAIADGRPVVVVDDTGRTDEGALVFAAQLATTKVMAFTVRHASGLVSVALTATDCDRLALPPMSPHDPVHRVAVDLYGTGTGISAKARACTVAALADQATTADDLIRPGHVLPVCAHDEGVLARPGPAEAAVDLARMARLHPAGVLSTIVSEERPGRMAEPDELARFARRHTLPIVTIGDIATARMRSEPQVVRGASASLRTRRGDFRMVGYRGAHDDAEHLALIAGDLGDGREVPVCVTVECPLGEVLGSCACGPTLDEAIATIAATGRGIVVYARPAGPAQACGLPENTTAEGSIAGRHVAAAILLDLGVTSVPASHADPEFATLLADHDIATYLAWQAAAG